jgi:hypothetical protein
MSLVPKSIKMFSPLEIFLVIIFIIYIIFPLNTPESIVSLVDSSLGIVLLLIITVYLFVYTSNPILGVIFIFVAYELVRRSARMSVAKYIEVTPSQRIKDIMMEKMNPPKDISLEEEIIQSRAPIGKSNTKIEKTTSNFRPVADKIINGASLI